MKKQQLWGPNCQYSAEIILKTKSISGKEENSAILFLVVISIVSLLADILKLKLFMLISDRFLGAQDKNNLMDKCCAWPPLITAHVTISLHKRTLIRSLVAFKVVQTFISALVLLWEYV